MNNIGSVETATRAVYWHIHNVWFIYVLTAISMGIFGYGMYRRARLWWKLGESTGPLGDTPARLEKLWREVAGQARFFRESVAGVMHASLMWSMALLFVGTIIVMIDVDFGVPIMRGWFYLIFQKLTLTLAGAFVATGCVIALIRRYVVKVARVQQTRPGAGPDYSHALSLAFLLLLILQGFALQAIRLAANPDPFAAWSPVGHLMSSALVGAPESSLILAYQIVWWFHLCTVLTWIAWLPFGKMIHIFTGPLNVFTGNPALLPRTPLPIDFESADHLGVSRIEHFTWKDLLDLDACTSCGRCEQACPAYASGAPLSPRNLILDLRDYMRSHGPVIAEQGDQAAGLPRLVGETISDETLWACTTCGACVRECPVHIEHVPKVINMRRHLTMEKSRVPPTLQEALKSLEDRAHPYKGASGDRTEWSKGLNLPVATDEGEFDVLYWVGCTASFDPRSQKVARDFVQLLQMAGVKVAVLGNDEPCCGDPARRMGHEYLYDQLARSNVELLRSVSPKRIVTACPHCLNALNVEYRQFGADFDVVHHTQLLGELTASGKLKPPAGTQGKITYHDPCYLGRYAGQFEGPRDLVDSVAEERVEMARNRSSSSCCGGGGGHAWMAATSQSGKPINTIRANQAIETGADTLAVGCPFCMKMMEDGIKTNGADTSLKVRDVAELLADSMLSRSQPETSRALR